MPSSWTFRFNYHFLLTGLILSILVRPGWAVADDVLKIDGVWLRAVPNSLSATALYFRVTNPSGTVYQLKGGKTGIAESLDPMITTRQGEGTQAMVGMQSVDALEVPARGQLILEPGGNHLMVIGLKEHPPEGTKVPVTLLFEPGPIEIRVEAIVSRTPVP